MFKSRLQSNDTQRIFFSFKFFIPQFGGVSFFYITIWIASQPSTYIATDLSLDACSIRVLLEVVECVATYKDIVQGVILPLMRPVELVQCIECKCDGYFTWIFPFFFTCTFLPHSSAFCLLVQVACSKPLEECSFFRLLGQLASSASILELLSMYWVRTNEGMSLSISLGWAHGALFCVQILPLP